MRLHTLGFVTVFCLGLLLAWQGITAVSPTQAAPTANIITVTTTDDSFFPDGLCSLREAVHNANNNSQAFGLAGECPAGSATETDVIVLASLHTYELTLTGNGNDEGDLDIFSNGLSLDLRIESDGMGVGWNEMPRIKMMVAGQRVIELHPDARVEFARISIRDGNGVNAGGGIWHGGAYLGLIQCLVRENSADTGGGIYSNGGELYMQGGTIFSNTANAGGGIYNDGGIVVLNSAAMGGNIGALGGGGILNAGPQARLTLTDSVLIGNRTSQYGGGIGNSEGTVLIDGQSYLEGNEADLGGGGAANLDGTLILTDSTVSFNDSNIGGGLYNWGISGPTAVMTVIHSAIRNNTTDGSGAGITNHDGHLHISDTAIHNNTGNVEGKGTGYGGGVFAFAQHHTTNTTIHGSLLFENQHNGYGGGIAIYDLWYSEAHAITRITATEIHNNSAERGAGIYTRAQDTLIAENSVIALNSATHRGGGIAVTDAYGQTILDNIIVRANSAGGGGGIDLVGGNLTIRNNTQITLNQAATGGGISNISATLEISDSTVQGNTASGVAGGIYSTISATTEVTDSLISDNSANAGGGFYTTDSSSLTIRNSQLMGNRATDGHGGGIFQSFAAQHLLVEESYLAENSTTDSGGAIYSESSAEIRQSLIVSNTAQFFGGGYYATTAGASCEATPLSRVSNNTFSGNEAQSGGGVAVLSGLTELTHVTIANNSAHPLAPGGLLARNNETTCARLGHTIVAHNMGGADVGASNTDQRLVSLGHNVIGTAGNNVDFSLELNLPSDQTNVADAGLAPLADNGGPTKTHALLEGSPAIGAGNPAICAAAPTNGVDQRGYARGAAACDSGAYEFAGVLLVYLPVVMR